MSLTNRMHYFVSCDIDGCEEQFDAGLETDAFMARIVTLQSGWQMRQQANAKGNKRRFDICSYCIAADAPGAKA
jgi:hypothetical protein